MGVLSVIYIAFISASISIFLDFCFMRGEALYWYRKFMRLRFLYGRVVSIKEGRWKIKTFRLSRSRVIETWLYMALGGCIFCTNFYISLAVGVYNNLPVKDIILIPVIAHVMLRIFLKYVES